MFAQGRGPASQALLNNNTSTANSTSNKKSKRLSIRTPSETGRLRTGLIHKRRSLLDSLGFPKQPEDDLGVFNTRRKQVMPEGNSNQRLDHRRDTRRRTKAAACQPNFSSALPIAPRIRSNGTHDFDPTVILLSFDGLRADYLQRGLTPELNSIGQRGVKAAYMEPSFPTLTFPNHWTLATGLYPDHHGIVANMFHDPELNADFNYRMPGQSWDEKWWNGEPIWETAVHHNQKSAVIAWPGGEALRKTRPTYHLRHRREMTVSNKLSAVLEWLDMPRDERPQVIAVYISEVDTVGHNHGPDARRLNQALQVVDAALGTFLAGLRERNLEDVVNVIAVSDHGMAHVDLSKAIFYDDYIDPGELIHEESMLPHLAIRTKDPKKTNEYYETLKRAQAQHHLNFKVYRREELPAEFNYGSNSRIAPVVVVVDPGYVMTRREMGVPVIGVHGWDNSMPEMRAIFLAQGPGFPNATITTDGQQQQQQQQQQHQQQQQQQQQQGDEKNGSVTAIEIEPFENVELKAIVARTVGLELPAHSTDGIRNGWLTRPC
ncbi:hypothetical protein DFQ27_001810 [Actinomortierella ambigua]|uniref:Uncharacterized protein n=1 Tax=Actinomortierella ambigua TaxID=1343610 RepID=A0A9P6U865_9FUNG|nr:hypothetical protein DFQ27_001810 [Actinomortierella ambigua]